MVAKPGMEEGGSAWRRWLPWLTKGSLAIADQGIFALSNFLINVLLARWLSPEDYGAFALAYSVFLSLLLVHNALLTTPMLVFGQGKYRERFEEYLGTLLRGHVALTLPGSVLLLVIALLLGRFYSIIVARAFFALALGAPFILLLWLLRRAFYAKLTPLWAAVSGVAYLVIFVTSITVLRVSSLLSPSTALLCMAGASFVTSILLLLKLRPKFAMDAKMFRAIGREHWNYGKWVAAGAGPNWVTDNIYFIVLPAWLGLAHVGALKALLNLAQPASQSISALGVLLMPILVRDMEAGGTSVMAKTMRFSNALFLAGSSIYLAVLWVFRFQIFHALYGDKFSGYEGWPLLAAALIPLAQGLPNVAGAALGAIEKPRLGFWADAWSALFALVVGVSLAYWLGVGGALLGIAMSYALMGFLTFYLYKQSILREPPVTHQPAAAVPGPPTWTEAS